MALEYIICYIFSKILPSIFKAYLFKVIKFILLISSKSDKANYLLISNLHWEDQILFLFAHTLP